MFCRSRWGRWGNLKPRVKPGTFCCEIADNVPLSCQWGGIKIRLKSNVNMYEMVKKWIAWYTKMRKNNMTRILIFVCKSTCKAAVCQRFYAYVPFWWMKKLRALQSNKSVHIHVGLVFFMLPLASVWKKEVHTEKKQRKLYTWISSGRAYGKETHLGWCHLLPS